MNENEKLEYTKEDLLSYIKIMKKLDRVSNKDNIVEQLRLCVNRVLDCNQYLRDLEKQCKKSRRLINKYAKQYQAMSPQEQVIYLAEAEKIFTAFDKIPKELWDEEYPKYKEVLKKYNNIKMYRWES